ncbi:MAG: hypothetical protein OEZ58_10545 [Gammaproteobacteria bacterium]|nr:hypothetical protein [Gammaproteobacteria bacterium]MDH5729420.1 hypothetical protein [Gammaproteobacteria bacterium]
MSNIVEFPGSQQKPRIDFQQVKRMEHLVDQAIGAHARLQSYADEIKADPVLSRMPQEVLISLLRLMLNDEKNTQQ